MSKKFFNNIHKSNKKCLLVSSYLLARTSVWSYRTTQVPWTDFVKFMLVKFNKIYRPHSVRLKLKKKSTSTLHAELRILKSISRHLRDENNRHGRAREADITVNLLNIILHRVD
jgi:hypothetical protein